MRRTLAALLFAALAACSPGAPKPVDLATLDKAKLTELSDKGDEAAKTELDKRQKAELKTQQKAAFDAAVAANDEAKLGSLAGDGNPWALYRRGEILFKSQYPAEQRAAFVDMEAAAAAGLADAQLWVGRKMAWGENGYPWKPASGMKMVEQAANQGLVDAMYALGDLYYADQPMHDLEKARMWLKKAADLGHEGAKTELAKLPPAAGDPPKP